MLDPLIGKLRLSRMRLVGADGTQLGVFTLAEAINLANDKRLDLILVTERADPPVVKLGNYHKAKYETEKAAKKKPRQELKEIQISFVEGEGDMIRKAKQASAFLEEGNSVHIRLRLRGRQKAHPDFAKEKLQKFLEKIEVTYKFMQEPRQEPNGFSTSIVKQK